MAKSKRDEKEEASEGGDYRFVMPEFDDAAFQEKEIQSSRLTFVVVGVSLVLGLFSWLLTVAPGMDWKLGWLPLFAGMFVLKPLLARLRYPEEQLEFKSLFGNYFLLFFSGLAMWTLLANIYY